PSSEQFGLTAQLRRAAVSVESNIAEGTGRRTPDDFARFLGMARGSAHEIMSQTRIALDLNFIDENVFNNIYSRYRGLSAGIFSCAEALKTRKSASLNSKL